MSTINTLYMNLVRVDDEALQPEEVLLEAKDEHKEEKVKLLQESEFCDYIYIILQAVAKHCPSYHTFLYEMLFIINRGGVISGDEGS